MTDPNRSIGVFIDYDNLTPIQKAGGMLDLVTKALSILPRSDSAIKPIKCVVRIYGGWYQEALITRLAQDLTVEIQREFPAIIRLPTQLSISQTTFMASAELAMALLQEPSHHLFNTYRRKGRPSNIRIESPQNVGCVDTQCLLPLMNCLFKAGSCPKPGCSVINQNLVYRHEQKIVDTMLSCDLIYGGSTQFDRVVLISGDDDFLPPIRTVLLSGIPAVRLHPKPNGRRASFPKGGATLLEMDI